MHKEEKTRKELEEELKERNSINLLLSKISTKFLNTYSDDISNEINKALINIKNQFLFENIFLVIFSSNNLSIESFYEAKKEDANSVKSDVCNIRPVEIPWNPELNTGGNEYFLSKIQDIKSLPKIAKENVKYLILPMEYKTSTIGYFGIKNNLIQKQEYLLTFKLIRDVFTNIIIHNRSECKPKEIQEQLIQSYELKSIRTFIKYILCDFNNMLTFIMGYSKLLKDTIEDHDICHSYIDEIINATNNIARLSKDLYLLAYKKEKSSIDEN